MKKLNELINKLEIIKKIENGFLINQKIEKNKIKNEILKLIKNKEIDLNIDIFLLLNS